HRERLHHRLVDLPSRRDIAGVVKAPRADEDAFRLHHAGASHADDDHVAFGVDGDSRRVDTGPRSFDHVTQANAVWTGAFPDPERLSRGVDEQVVYRIDFDGVSRTVRNDVLRSHGA